LSLVIDEFFAIGLAQRGCRAPSSTLDA